jgi:hypothetical protein
MGKRLIWAGLAVWVISIVVVAKVVASREPWQAGAARTFTAEIAAEGIEIFDMSATDGSVFVTGTTAEKIRISVDVSASQARTRWYQRNPGDPTRADLMTERRGKAFVARVRAAGDGPLVERWTIQVPQRLRVGIVARDSGIDVTDVAGGVLANANAGLDNRPGRIRVSVPGGLLDLSLNVGTIDAQTTTVARGPVDVRSSVGDARLSIAGRQIRSPRKPGPGHRLKMDDTGPDPMTVRVNVGDASLIIR